LNANKQAQIQNIYNNISRGLGQGLASFYHQVASTHLNITKQETDTFLRKQGDYMITRIPRRPRVNKPIEASVPNERWAIDLLDMNAYQNGHNKWIMVIIDYFSNKIFARSMTNKRGGTLRTTFETIMNVNNTVPHIIQGDGEFHQGAFRDCCAANDIRLIKTSPYTPTSNGKVERANREVRKVIRAGFVRNNNFVWSANLASYISNINSQQNARSKQTPNSLWTQGYTPLPAGHVRANGPLNDNLNLQQRQDIHNAYIEDRTQRLLQTGNVARLFNVGDSVRIKLANVSNPMRERNKKQVSKNLSSVHYTPEVYSVTNVRNFPGLRPPEYYVMDNLGNQLMSGATPKVFFGSELLFVPPLAVNVSLNPANTARANQMNRL
jgi:transposase InsO family protein